MIKNQIYIFILKPQKEKESISGTKSHNVTIATIKGFEEIS